LSLIEFMFGVKLQARLSQAKEMAYETL
jgi:hypothetical protein